MNNLNDERGSLPSASPFSRYAKCPPSHRLGLGIKSEGSDVSRAGDRIHRWLQFDGGDKSMSSFDTPLQNADESWCANRCLEDRKMLEELVHGDSPHALQIHRELRMWDKLRRYSGVPDYVAIAGKHALIADYKTGPIAVEHASMNKQLMALAVLVANNFDVDEITVAVIQPKCGQPTLYRYDKKGMRNARQTINRILRRLNDPTLKPKPGPKQCRYCNAKPICPALKDEVNELVAVVPDALTPQRVSQVLSKAKVVKELIKSVEDRARRMIKERPDCIPGWFLKDGSMRRTVKDSGATCKKLEDSGLPFDVIINSTTFSLSKLERNVAEYIDSHPDAPLVWPEHANKIVREQLRGLLEELIEEKQCEPRLTAVGD